MKNNRTPAASAVLIGLLAAALNPALAAASSTARVISAAGQNGMLLTKTLDECLVLAMEENRRRPASRFAVAAAEAQHRQALAAYWPQVSAKGGYQRLNQGPLSISQPTDFTLPPGAATVTVPAGVLGPAPVVLPVATPAQTIQVPPTVTQLMDPDSFRASVDVTWLLFDGGMRRGHREQVKGLIDMMKEEARRTDLEIIDTVERYYYGAVLARLVHGLGKETLTRMEVTLSLTERMYKEGAGKVNKTDYLDNLVMVESIRGILAMLEQNEAMAQAALANAIGQSWRVSIAPADTELPYQPFTQNLEELVGVAYEFNPDWNKIDAGIRAAEGAVRTARSGHAPTVAVTGEVHRWWNDLGSGVATGHYRKGGSVSVGVKIPLFQGFLTKNKIVEAKARVAKIREEKFLLREGIGLQVKNAFLGLISAEKNHAATHKAMEAAADSRDLNTRAYQAELAETEDVIRAQLMESLMTARHYKARFDHLANQSRLNVLVGTDFLSRLDP